MQDYYNGKMSLRPFLESIKSRCENMAREDLTGFIMYYAENVPAKGRIDFLDNIASFSNAETIPEFDETLIDKISDLKDEVKTRCESIEDGSFYDENEWNHYYDDEESDYFSDEQKEEMEEYFNQADSFFLSGELVEACSIYKELYSIFNNEDSFYGLDESSIDIEHRETKARYLRCIYETSNPAERAKNLLKKIDIQAPLSDYRYDIYENDDPLLVDIEDAKLEELPGKREFLFDWIELVTGYGTDRANILLLEAVYVKDGIDGVQELARKWKGRQPRGYLFWINILKDQKDWNKVIDTAREASSVITFNYLRGVIAREMINAGEKKDLEIKVLMMNGNLSDAFLKVNRANVLGWSYSYKSVAILFAGILTALVIENIQEAEIIKIILKRYTETGEL